MKTLSFAEFRDFTKTLTLADCPRVELEVVPEHQWEERPTSGENVFGCMEQIEACEADEGRMGALGEWLTSVTGIDGNGSIAKL